MAEVIFPREHYETAKRFGFDHFSDTYGMARAEMATTIDALLAQDENVTFSRRDLIGYYFMQYGVGDLEVANSAIDWALRDDAEGRDWVIQTDNIAKVLEADVLSGPISLGRIALGWYEDYPRELDKTMEWVNVMARGGVQREGGFLYPNEGTEVHYLGRGSVDLLRLNPDGYIKRYHGHNLLLDDFVFNVDAFRVSAHGVSRAYNALSCYESSISKDLVGIVEVK